MEKTVTENRINNKYGAGDVDSMKGEGQERKQCKRWIRERRESKLRKQ